MEFILVSSLIIGLHPFRKNFTHMYLSPIYSKSLQIYTLPLRPSNREHARFTVTQSSIFKDIPEDPVMYTCCWAVGEGTVSMNVLTALGIWTHDLPHHVHPLPLCHCSGFSVKWAYFVSFWYLLKVIMNQEYFQQ